jgi:multicomponent Na+:H+ antiporter subunit G
MNILEIVSAVMIGAGTLFFLGTAVGVVRFPDFYTRMHAAGKGDTLSSILILGGLALLHIEELSLPNILLALKILCIVLFILITSPTSTHAIMQAGYDYGIKPWKRKDKTK